MPPLKRLFLLVALLIPFILQAQQNQENTDPEVEPTPTPPPAAQIEFSVFVWPSQGIMMDDAKVGGVPKVFYSSPQGDMPVRLTRNSSTPLLPYVGELPLSFYSMQEEWTPPPADAPAGTPPTMKRLKTTRFTASFPPTWKRVMIILFPGRQTADGKILTLCLPYGQEEIQPGMARIFNASDRMLVLQFEDAVDKPLAIKPNENLLFDPSKLTDKKFARVYVYGLGKNERQEMIHTSRLFFEEDKSNYFFLYPYGTRRVRILRIAGHPGSESEKEKEE